MFSVLGTILSASPALFNLIITATRKIGITVPFRRWRNWSPQELRGFIKLTMTDRGLNPGRLNREHISNYTLSQHPSFYSFMFYIFVQIF